MTAGDDGLRDLYRRMVRIRCFEETACALLADGAIEGAVHTCIGQEAAIVGACAALRADDWITGTHRSHGHPIAKGAALGPLVAELMGRETGVCRGRGGSMHLADLGVGCLGASGIVGAGIALASGAALSAQMRRTGQVALCFFGDGASSTGVFHETLNMAAVWKLPVVYLCENNRYAATTPAARALAVEQIAERAAAYGMPGVVVDGQDVTAVRAAVEAAVARARSGGGPSLVEAKTYRYREHAEGYPIPGSYRSGEEMAAWRARDPIALHRRRLLADGVLTAAQAAGIEAAVREEMARAVAFGKASPAPDSAEVLTGVYATPVAARPAVAPPPTPGGREITGFDAVMEALREEMARDERVIYLGEDIGLFAELPLLDRFADRVRSTPIAEAGFTGMAVGAAMTGLRPVVELTVANFTYSAMDQLVNQAAKLRYMSGGKVAVPAVFRAAMWHGNATAAQHSDRPYPMFMGVPGLKVVVPATPYDMKGLLKSAIRDDDPVLVFDELSLWFRPGPVPEEEYLLPLGVAEVKRAGRDVTVVAIGTAVGAALEAADAVAADRVSVEVIDPRTLVPLDRAAILASVGRTGRLVVVEHACRTNGAGAEIAALVAEEAFGELRAPVVRVSAPDVPIPFSRVLEQPLYPSAARIVAAVRGVVETSRARR